MNDENPWRDDSEILSRGVGSNAEKLTTLIDSAGAQAKAGNLVAAADSLESVRACLLAETIFGVTIMTSGFLPPSSGAFAVNRLRRKRHPHTNVSSMPLLAHATKT